MGLTWKSYIVTTPKIAADEVICSELDTVCNMLAEQGYVVQSITSHGRRLVVLASHAEQSDDDGLGAEERDHELEDA